MSVNQWGERYNTSQPYALDHDCPNCEWRPKFPDVYSKFATGFDPNCPPSKRENWCGAMVIECPECFTKYWFHVNEDLLEGAKGLYPEKFKDLHIDPEGHEGKRK